MDIPRRSWHGTIRCSNACIVRRGAPLDSELVCELPPGTRVAVVGEATADNRRRLQLNKPCDGWVTGKFVEAVPEPGNPSGRAAWVVEGQETLFPSAGTEVTKKTPMGRQLDLFAGDAAVDRGFASPAMMSTDRAEMALWLVRELKRFDSALGEDVKAPLLNSLSAAASQAHRHMQQVAEQQPQQPQHPQQLLPVPSIGRAPSAPSCGPKRPKAIYVAGVEGTGHHGFMPLLLYPAVRQYGKAVLAWWRSLREVLLKTPPADRRAQLGKLLGSMRASSGEDAPVIFEWCSYPFGEQDRGRWAAGCLDPEALAREEGSGNPGNSVDLREFVQLFKEHADVKVLVLHRSIVASAWSHKDWDGSLLQHGRVLALFTEYLTNVLGSLEPEAWRWVAYEDVCAAHRRGQFGEVALALGDFLGLSQAPLHRAFERFRPSTKDAAAEMPPSILQELRALEAERGDRWFPAMFPSQRLLAQPCVVAAELQAAHPAPPAPREVDPAVGQAFARLAERFNEEQQQAWLEFQASGDASEEVQALLVKRLQVLLSEDQMFLLRKALVIQRSSEVAHGADVDPDAYTCVHMQLGGCGFGSEVNNLLSAAVYCSQHGLDCVVEDAHWNSGRLHDYLQAEPLVLRKCLHAERCHPLAVRRDRRVATVGWFAICRHAQGVSFQTKAEYARKAWLYTRRTADKVKEMNRELNLPSKYVAVQIRRGDKVAGGRRETLKVTTLDYARAAASQCLGSAACGSPGCRTVVVCSDDASAGQELKNELVRTHPELSVRWRRSATPRQLRTGHWQQEWNILPEQDRTTLTHEFLADLEVMRAAAALVCTYSSNVGRLAALLRDGPTISLDDSWTNT